MRLSALLLGASAVALANVVAPLANVADALEEAAKDASTIVKDHADGLIDKLILDALQAARQPLINPTIAKNVPDPWALDESAANTSKTCFIPGPGAAAYATPASPTMSPSTRSKAAPTSSSHRSTRFPRPCTGSGTMR